MNVYSFHSAGDGKLGGLTLPNNGLCHLNYTGYCQSDKTSGMSQYYQA